MPQPNNTTKPSHSVAKSPIVLVHGFRGAPIGLKAIADFLRTHGYTVYTPAIPPFGGAPILPEYAPTTYSDYLAQYIQDHHLHRPILIGHSMGSLIAASFLEKYPSLAHSKAILLSPISRRPALPFRLITPLTAILPSSMIDYITTRYLFIPKDRKLLRRTLKITRACSHDHTPTKAQVFKSSVFSSRYSITDFTMSQHLLLLAGEKDRLISKKSTTKLAQQLHTQAIFLPDCGHLHNYEKPHETAAEIIKFLES